MRRDQPLLSVWATPVSTRNRAILRSVNLHTGASKDFIFTCLVLLPSSPDPLYFSRFSVSSQLHCKPALVGADCRFRCRFRSKCISVYWCKCRYLGTPSSLTPSAALLAASPGLSLRAVGKSNHEGWCRPGPPPWVRRGLPWGYTSGARDQRQCTL